MIGGGPLAGFLEEPLGPLGVVHVGHGHAPVGHGAVGVDLRGLAERPLGLEVKEGMELGNSLVDERLGFGLLGGDREVDLAHAGHEVGVCRGPSLKASPCTEWPGAGTAGLASEADAVGLIGSSPRAKGERAGRRSKHAAVAKG